eukprot:scaffold25384_cov129-Isochrysis_galbana.AAC.7
MGIDRTIRPPGMQCGLAAPGGLQPGALTVAVGCRRLYSPGSSPEAGAGARGGSALGGMQLAGGDGSGGEASYRDRVLRCETRLMLHVHVLKFCSLVDRVFALAPLAGLVASLAIRPAATPRRAPYDNPARGDDAWHPAPGIHTVDSATTERLAQCRVSHGPRATPAVPWFVRELPSHDTVGHSRSRSSRVACAAVCTCRGMCMWVLRAAYALFNSTVVLCVVCCMRGLAPSSAVLCGLRHYTAAAATSTGRHSHRAKGSLSPARQSQSPITIIDRSSALEERLEFRRSRRAWHVAHSWREREREG